MKNENQLLKIERILGLDGKPALIPVSKSTWDRGVKSGKYPQPVQISERVRAWRESDIRALIAPDTKASELPPISKSDLGAARLRLGLLKPALDALSELLSQNMGLGLAECDALSSATTVIERKLFSAQRTIQAAEDQMAAFDERWLTLAIRRLHEVATEIGSLKHRVTLIESHHKEKTQDLTKKGYSESEIAQILVDPASEIAETQQILENLKIEKRKIERFIADDPRHDRSFLSGTGVEALFLSLVESTKPAKDAA